MQRRKSTKPTKRKSVQVTRRKSKRKSTKPAKRKSVQVPRRKSKRKSVQVQRHKRSTTQRVQYSKLRSNQKSCYKAKVGYVMGEFKARRLRSSSGQMVTNPKQGIAIALSEARRSCLKNKK